MLISLPFLTQAWLEVVAIAIRYNTVAVLYDHLPDWFCGESISAMLPIPQYRSD
jgi:hypothetical protein